MDEHVKFNLKKINSSWDWKINPTPFWTQVMGLEDYLATRVLNGLRIMDRPLS